MHSFMWILRFCVMGRADRPGSICFPEVSHKPGTTIVHLLQNIIPVLTIASFKMLIEELIQSEQDMGETCAL